MSVYVLRENNRMFGYVCLCVDMKICGSDEEINERLKMSLENE